MRPVVKICGITNLSDAELSLRLGADWLGFNFYPRSPRYIKPETAADLIQHLPENTVSVGVFVNESLAQMARIAQLCSLTMVQLHGDENPADAQAAAKETGLPVIKAIRIQSPADMTRLEQVPADYILLDAFRKELYGGTGESFVWSWIPRQNEVKILLAGGINPDTIADALRVGTFGVDICSGVESKPGIKDPEKMNTLFQRIHRRNG